MLISRKYRFIFIHIYKNAGTSIKHALSPYIEVKWQNKANYLLKKIGVSLLDSRPLNAHVSASEIILKIGKKKFQSYFSFAIVRNPWDWQVSLYSYMLKNKNHRQHELVKNFRSFEEYLGWRCKEDVWYQKDFVYSADNEKLVDFIGKYESLDQDFKTICDKIGISTSLPKLNVSKSRPYQEYYNDETINLVRKTFQPDIRIFNYDFE
jgi:hypothetical protein